MRPDLRGLRVLLVGDWPPPLGGVSVHMHALREAARRAGGRVTVLDIGRGQHDGPGVVASGSEAKFAISLATLAALHDVVHLHTSGANPKSWGLTMLTGRLARAFGAKPVVTFHSGHGPRWLVSSARALGARLSLSSFERIVCVSEEIARTLSRLGILGRRGIVAPAFGRDGLAPGRLPPEARRARNSHRVMVSAMLGTTPDYGAEELFQAFAGLRRHVEEAVLVVYGPGSTQPQAEELSARAGIVPVRLGPIDHPAALAVMKASDLFVRPTRVDGDAVTVREALALGTRVVATRTGTRPAGITPCEPGRPADLARAMRLALAGPPPNDDETTDGIRSVLELYGELKETQAERRASGERS